MSSNSESSNYYESFQDFLDDVQYSKQGVKRYEWIFGEAYLSTGGLETTEEIIPLLKLKPGNHVLDVGCGLGGHDFYMAEKYQAHIDAIDLSKNMMSVARDHLQKRSHLAHLINFQICDVTTTPFKEGHYDAIYSRDTMIHISDKEKLFQKYYKWLKPGGRLVFTDYCRGDKEDFTEEFKKYVAQRGYHLYSVPQYGELMRNVGFINVVSEDRQGKFVESLNKELNKLYDGKDDFLAQFNQEDYTFLEEGWLAKIQRTKTGDQTWVLGIAEKPL